jgi:uncharacterized membrane protein YeaQ/YmgE (transglycosylase-associated protein family)
MIASIIWIIVIGFVAGFFGRWLATGAAPKNLQDVILATVLGIVGAFLVTWIGQAIGWYRPDQGAGFIATIVGAVGAVLIYNAVRGRRVPASGSGMTYAPRKAPDKPAAKAPELETKAPAEASTSARIFISYRREKDEAIAGRIFDLLKDKFNIFMDVDGIPLGIDFVTAINEAVAKCDVLVAVIGRDWLDARDEAGDRRLDNADDFNRLEISAALQRQIPVVPILVGTKMPKADQLPPDLQGLARRQGLEVRHASFQADMDRLVRQLRSLPVGPTTNTGQPPSRV